MSGKTHAIVGANAIWLTLLYGMHDPLSIGVLMLAGTIAGLLPDIDAVHAKIHSLGGGVLGGFRGMFRHRGFFHSVLATCIVLIMSVLSFMPYDPLLPFVVTLGYASHLLIDGLNRPGAEYLFPYRKRIRLVPKMFASRINGIVDQLLFVFGIFGVLTFLLLHLNIFMIK